MIFELIRWVLFIVLIVIILFVSKKIHRKKKFLISSIIISFLVITLSANLPFENLFVNFDTPEKVFKYTNSGAIVDIVDGKDSCMIIYSTNRNGYNLYFVPKSKNGYKIPHYRYAKNILQEQNEKLFYVIKQTSKTNDYFLYAFTTSKDENINLKSNKSNNISNFVLDNDINEIKQIIFYEYIDNYEADDYYLIINDEKVIIKE